MTTINWGSSSLEFAGVQRVYTKQNWADSWSLQSSMWAEDISWSLLPAMPTATIVRDYGQVLVHNATSWSTQSKLSIGGYYVKIEVDCEDGTLSWYGFIDEVADMQGGRTTQASGRQVFVAYAMPQVLALHYITKSRWWDGRTDAARESDSAITFNPGGKPNRTPTVKSGEDVHLFMARDRQLNTAPDRPDWWTTKTIVEYIFKHAMPLADDGTAKIKFDIDGIDLLPDWDKPVIECEGRSVLSILLQLVNASRLLQFSTYVNESTSPDTVVLKVHSLADSDLSLPNGETHTANDTPLDVITVDSQDTQVTTQRSETQTVHQIIVRGSLRETCGTWTMDPVSGLLTQGWNSTDETAYENAASASTGYSGLSDSDKRRRNEAARSKPILKDVFRSFDLNSSFDFLADTGYVFETDETPAGQYYPYWGMVQIMPQLPLKPNVDYSGTYVDDGTAFDSSKDVQDYRQPYVLFKRPSSSPDSFIQAEKMASRTTSPLFSVQVGLENDQQSLILDVNGSEQYAIAHGNFTALPVDYTTTQLGSWTYDDCKFTLSLQEDRWCEARYPADEDLPTRDAIRRKIIYAGEAYQLVRVLPNTIVDLETDGTETTSDGGVLVDDRDKLESLAMIAASWWLTPRQVLRLVSARPSATVTVGMFLTTVNTGTTQAATINTVVSEIRIAMQRGEDGAPGTVSYSLTTAMGELDPLAFSPPLDTDVWGGKL